MVKIFKLVEVSALSHSPIHPPWIKYWLKELMNWMGKKYVNFNIIKFPLFTWIDMHMQISSMIMIMMSSC